MNKSTFRTFFRRIILSKAIRSNRWNWLAKKFVNVSGNEYADLLRARGAFAHIGEDCSILPSCFISIPELTWIGSNVRLATCSILNHGGEVNMINKLYNCQLDSIGPVTIEDNVFVGYQAIIMKNVRINSGCIVAAGAVVTKDVEANCVVGGFPARRIMSTDEYLERLRSRCEEWPWMEIVQSRSGAFDGDLESILNRKRAEYFRETGRLGPSKTHTSTLEMQNIDLPA